MGRSPHGAFRSPLGRKSRRPAAPSQNRNRRGVPCGRRPGEVAWPGAALFGQMRFIARRVGGAGWLAFDHVARALQMRLDHPRDDRDRRLVRGAVAALAAVIVLHAEFQVEQKFVRRDIDQARRV